MTEKHDLKSAQPLKPQDPLSEEQMDDEAILRIRIRRLMRLCILTLPFNLGSLLLVLTVLPFKEHHQLFTAITLTVASASSTLAIIVAWRLSVIMRRNHHIFMPELTHGSPGVPGDLEFLTEWRRFEGAMRRAVEESLRVDSLNRPFTLLLSTYLSLPGAKSEQSEVMRLLRMRNSIVHSASSEFSGPEIADATRQLRELTTEAEKLTSERALSAGPIGHAEEA